MVIDWEESVTYQAILEKGVIRGYHDLLLQVGGKKIGAPTDSIIAAIRGIAEVAQLRELAERLFDVSSWQELLRNDP